MSKSYIVRKQDFVGLSNQGATCYMNSLLQTLYMTPEFRREIYKWTYEARHGSKENCIPLQLQLLFARLQTSNTYSIETTALTKSFGWTHAESFQQHDVQEFCRVLFEAIEKSGKENNQIKFIQNMYEGKYADYVNCLACGNESTREDKFLDLSLTINNKFENIYNDSVEKAIKNYVKPENLSGTNQYNCENCKQKQDALKGLKIKELPYILVLQLKRFDYDYAANKRIKINDKVSFEELMNLNFLMQKDLGERENMDMDSLPTESLPFIDPPELVNHNFKFLINTCKDQIPLLERKIPLPMENMSKKLYIEAKISKKKTNWDNKVQEFLSTGEYVYELYSVMIHSGSAWGGHYYAYIKCFETSKWYNFNDSNVTEISTKELTKVFGESSSWGSSTSAYLLMYRKVSSEKNIIKVEDSEISNDTISMLESFKKKSEDEEIKRKEDLKKINIRVKYKKDIKDIQVKHYDTISILKNATLIAYGLEIDPKDSRLRDLDINDRMSSILKDDMRIDKIQISHNKKLAIEIKLPNEEFEDYDPMKMILKVIPWKDVYLIDSNLEEIIENPDTLRIIRNATVKELIDIISYKYDINTNCLKIFKKNAYNVMYSSEAINITQTGNEKLNFCSITENTLLFIEKHEDKMQKSKWQVFFDQESSKTTIKVILHENFQNTDYRVSIHPQKTLSELKSMISKKFNIPESEFIMRKNTGQTPELKDMNQSVKQTNLPNNDLIISRGIPLKPNQIRLMIYISVINQKPLKDSEFFSIYQLFDMPADLEWGIPVFKAKIREKIMDYFPTLHVANMRLREIQNEKLSKWIDDTMRINDISNFDNKRLAIQSIRSSDFVKEKDDIIIAVRRFIPNTWELEQAVEVKINHKGTLHKIGEILSIEFDIPLEKIETYKISTQSFNRSELLYSKFEKLYNRNEKGNYGPLYLGDGACLIIKDMSEKIREMTADEKFKYAPKSASSFGKHFSREKDLKIAVRNS
ncbi:hypothetical protein SteCoe_18584 [Stentor coeruleus]|uniref:Ubiquitin carboxyl-terminal hydrolase n=1 Tax=Stentor coeruleus TaxID=5963 RepID=A0A1R2BW28_9CILI|nr:hypothetical protein SteCoe_18584 [Stentor coeruleus]